MLVMGICSGLNWLLCPRQGKKMRIYVIAIRNPLLNAKVSYMFILLVLLTTAICLLHTEDGCIFNLCVM